MTKDTVQLTELQYWKLKQAITAYELFSVKVRAAIAEAEGALGRAFAENGLEADRTYTLDSVKFTATPVDGPPEKA